MMLDMMLNFTAFLAGLCLGWLFVSFFYLP